MSPSEFRLRIETSDKVAEIAVLDASQEPVLTGLGQVDEVLPAGLYKMRARLGPAILEQLVSLDHDQTLTISEDDFQFPTPVPLVNTARTRVYHQQAAIDASRMTPVDRGTGATILVFARDWSPDEKTIGNPMLGLTLHDAAGENSLDLTEGADLRQAGDVSAGNLVSVNPGAFRLRLTLADGTAFERMIIAVPKWQTQIFLFARDYDTDRRADLAGGAIVMAGGAHNPNSVFDPAGKGERVAVLARYALTQHRPVADAVYRELFDLKFDDPILGLLAAHLLMRDEPDQQDLLAEVMGNLRAMLGPDHPDVQALDLGGDASRTSGIPLRSPPMLRVSWDLMTAASVTRPAIIPDDAIFDSVQAAILPSAPWLVWRADGGAEKGGGAASDEPEHKLEALKAFVVAHGKSELSKRQPGPRFFQMAAPAAATGTVKLADDVKVELTRSLGVTGPRLDAMLSSVLDDTTKTD